MKPKETRSFVGKNSNISTEWAVSVSVARRPLLFVLGKVGH
jgi:hypothetical protein